MTPPMSPRITTEAVVDRFEDADAILEVLGAPIRVPRVLLPAGAREGDVVRVEFADEERRKVARIELDAAATARIRGEAERLLARLRGDD